MAMNNVNDMVITHIIYVDDNVGNSQYMKKSQCFFFMVRLMDLRPVLDCLSVHDRYKKKHKFQFSIKQNKKNERRLRID